MDKKPQKPENDDTLIENNRFTPFGAETAKDAPVQGAPVKKLEPLPQ